jgi:uridine nucleosidase
VVGLDVTHECRLTGTQVGELAGRGRHGAFLSSITQFYLQYHR